MVRTGPSSPELTGGRSDLPVPADQLAAALSSRTVIGQAIGIIMVRQGLDGDRAFERLVQLSQHRNVKLREVARQLVAELDAAHRPGEHPGPARRIDRPRLVPPSPLDQDRGTGSVASAHRSASAAS